MKCEKVLLATFLIEPARGCVCRRIRSSTDDGRYHHPPMPSTDATAYDDGIRDVFIYKYITACVFGKSSKLTHPEPRRVKAGCADPPDFLEKHNAFLLTVIASGSAALGLIFSYFLKSRCRTISIFNGCIACDRTPVDLEVTPHCRGRL